MTTTSATRQNQDPYHRAEARDGMRIDWNVPIPISDGIVLRADLFRPIEEARCPVILTYGAYGKGLAFAEGYPIQWNALLSLQPEVLDHSSGTYMNWEVPDPERFVPDGYALLRIDSRGAGWSPGYQNYFSSRETLDIYESIEWAGKQTWSNGKVGMAGVSYYAENQWCVAALEPPHLAAIIPWGGFIDVYRELNYHGGILCEFMKKWDPIHLKVQYGAGDRALRNPTTGESVAGPVTLSDAELGINRIDLWGAIKAHSLCDAFHAANTADISKLRIPLLSAANWGGQGMHTRGNFTGFVEAPVIDKWLLAHGSTDYATFYSDSGVALQKRFFDHFLKGSDNGWPEERRVQLQVRYPGERFVLRMENEWPLVRTRWTRFYLTASDLQLTPEPPRERSGITYNALGDGVTFSLPVRERELEITGPLAAKLFISSETEDADLFLVVRLFEPNGLEVTFQGAIDPNTPVANGWLRASHRRLDRELSFEYRPYHVHDRREPLTPGAVYELDIEIWPTCIVIPPGYRLALTVRGRDYEYEGALSELARTFHYATRGTGGMTHADPDDRPATIYGRDVTLHCGGETPSHVLVPIIP